MSRLRKRLDRLGTLNDVQKVFADTCCDGKKDVKKHLCVDLFPNVTKTPFADLFHKVQILSTHTLSAHPLHAPFTRYALNPLGPLEEGTAARPDFSSRFPMNKK